ncbi:MAG: 30S ribosomal protein S16 [Alphaproteobacteria bacterium]|nr:30S ribosomal protein S16 [Alphaproteobacteria bacterium]MDD9919127.1 30S ribosomal protein S16 [Alphaproteobacteria bacterium]
MSVKIRLSRGGRKKLPFYHIVAADARSPRDGRFIERLGYYNPMAKEGEIAFHIKEDRLNYWHSVGAQTNDAVAKLLVETNQGPQSIRDAFTKRKNARIELKKDELEAKRKAKEAEEKAAAEAKAAEEAAAAAEAKAAEEAAASEEAPAENAEQAAS